VLAKRLYVQLAKQSLPSLRGSGDVVPEDELLRRYDRILHTYSQVKRAVLSIRRDTEAVLGLQSALPELDSVEAGALVDAMKAHDTEEVRTILLRLAGKPFRVSASTVRQAIVRGRNRQRVDARVEQLLIHA
jgi:hypothetical protein